MMKIFKALFFCVAAFGSGFSHATPVTYDFTVNSYTSKNDSTNIFGTGMSFAISVDGGTTSGTVTTYDFADIRSFSASAIGGSLSLATSNVSVGNGSDIVPFLSFDSTTGVATLSLGDQSGGLFANWQAYDVTSHVQVDMGYGPYNQAGVHNLVFGTVGSGLYSFAEVNGSGPLTISGTREPGATVPEPTTFALMGLGLVGLGISRRKAKPN